MKIRTKLLSALLVCVAATAWNAVASNFTVNVKVGSAEAEPALIFGQAAAASQIPYPPFSAMFGVKDIYLANPGNFVYDPDNAPDNFKSEPVSGDMSRLGTDIRTDASGNEWVIVASSDATLYFDKNGAPALSVIDSTDGAVASELGDSLSVKAGVDYTISMKSVDDVRSVVVAPDPTKARLFLEQDETSGLYLASSEALDAIKAAGDVTISVVVTDEAPVIFTKNAGAPKTLAAGWCIDLTSDKITSLAQKSDTEWTISFSGADTLVVNAYAASNLKPMTFYAVAEGLKVLEVNCLIKGSGTLDFDGDGEVTNNDTMYMYNFVNNGCPLEDFGAEELAYLTYDATPDMLQTALETMQGNILMLDFDGDGEVTNNDTMYMYNFVNNGCPLEDFGAEELAYLTYDTTSEMLQQALDNLQALAPKE